MTVYVTLCRCKKCGHHWTQSNEDDVTWETDKCGRCGGEGKCVEAPGEVEDGFSKNRWCPEGVLMTWSELPRRIPVPWAERVR
jgi:hypothetical protein